MREILFRGKRIENGEWVEGSFVFDETAVIVQGLQYQINEKGKVELIDIHSVDLNTVGQYTGLLDKNGKKIFEGDIVKIDGYEKGYEVKYMLGQFFVGIHMPIAYKRFDCEIIGNIHDNPEFLEVDNGT